MPLTSWMPHTSFVFFRRNKFMLKEHEGEQMTEFAFGVNNPFKG